MAWSEEAWQAEVDRATEERTRAIAEGEFLRAAIWTAHLQLLAVLHRLKAESSEDCPTADGILVELRRETDATLGGERDAEFVRELLAELPTSRLESLLDECGLSKQHCEEKQDFIERLGWQPDAAASELAASQAAPVDEVAQAELLQYWAEHLRACGELAGAHKASNPSSRRCSSWGRALAFERAHLGALPPCPLPRERAGRPFVIWVVGCSAEVEVFLADTGGFDDANWVDRAAMEVVLLGGGLDAREMQPLPPPLDGVAPKIRAASYEDVQELKASAGAPDLVALFMPPLGKRAEDIVPQAVLEEVASVPFAVFLRARPPHGVALELRRALGDRLWHSVARCPFSAQAAVDDADYDDNGWVLSLRSGTFLGDALAVLSEQVHERLLAGGDCDPGPASPESALFWGIVDLKFDPARPLTDRLKVLETGDGRISKFSHEGAEIARKAAEQYKVKLGDGPQKFTVVSTDKRLTHDILDQSGYGHLVPKQVCLPRKYDEGLARRISEGLALERGLRGGDVVVLKLCNRSRGAGVLMVAATDLDATLHDVLHPPADLETWLAERSRHLSTECAFDLGLHTSPAEEQLRHWWGNECPSFIAERFVPSMPVDRDGRSFDPTLRVSFALRRRAGVGSGPCPPPEDLAVDWLGGYWKLPHGDLTCRDLRERSVSAARIAGTVAVAEEHLHEVYAALGDSMQQLFGGPEPSVEELLGGSEGQPERAAYLVARLGMSGPKDPEKVQARLDLAEEVLDGVPDGVCRQTAESFISRARGVCAIRKGGARLACVEQWELAAAHFHRAVSVLPTNANALFWLGMVDLELGKLADVLDRMNRSLLLDPDFKGPYVNLGAAYIRLGEYERAIEVSNACLQRFPESPHCNYHLGVASYQQAVKIFEREEQCQTVDELLRMALEVAAEHLAVARESDEAKKFMPERIGRKESPWLEEDAQMLAEAQAALKSAASPMPRAIRLPPKVGWRFLNWRT